MSNVNANYLVSVEINALIDTYIDTLLVAYINTLNTLKAEVMSVFSKVNPSDIKQIVQDKMQSVYEVVGAAAWQSMMSSYGSLVARGKTPSYRAGRGRLPGELLGALRSKEGFYQVDSAGLYFGNISFMDQSAKHWRRITFGAIGEGHGIYSDVELNYHGVSLGRLAIQQPPSGEVMIPPGFWVNNQFTPYTHKLAYLRARGISTEMRPTRGIATHDYLTAALNRMAKEFPVEIERVVRAAFDEVLRNIPHEIKEEVITRVLPPGV